jgi:hypothetical protein
MERGPRTEGGRPGRWRMVGRGQPLLPSPKVPWPQTRGDSPGASLIVRRHKGTPGGLRRGPLRALWRAWGVLARHARAFGTTNGCLVCSDPLDPV